MRLLLIFLLLFSKLYALEETFLLVNGTTNEKILEFGPQLNERFSPCSTFKIVLSLMGYDAGILKDMKSPVIAFEEGYDDFLENWKTAQTPESWMKNSCVWYSKVIALQMEKETFKTYLASMNYGNQDASAEIAKLGESNPCAWINSSIKISPKEQVDFLQKMVLKKLPISATAIQMTKDILFKEELDLGFKLYGKTGWSGSIGKHNDQILEFSWFVGWIEKDDQFFPFAYFIRDKKIDLTQRIPRVKQLLTESGIISSKS